jgi:hypothetical protein
MAISLISLKEVSKMFSAKVDVYSTGSISSKEVSKVL